MELRRLAALLPRQMEDIIMHCIPFPEPLTEGTVIERRNRFGMLVELEENLMECHCPTTWNIGQLDVVGRPCLLSKCAEPDPRKTPYTVEAVSMDMPAAPQKRWIGINQTASNRYIETFLKHDSFPDMLPSSSRVRRARLSGKSSLDFIVGDAVIAIKMPLLTLPDIPLGMRSGARPSSLNTERFRKRITKLAHSLPNIRRILLLTVYLHDHPDFDIAEYRRDYPGQYEAIREIAVYSTALGIENWQVNLSLDSTGVRLDRYLPLSTKE